MDKKKVIITGITGMDGSHLAELLLKKNYEVYGIIRRSSSFNTGRIDHIFSQLKLFYGDMTDSTNLIALIKKIQPDEIYNLAAQSHVSVSFEIPEYSANADAIGVLRLLEAIRLLDMCDKVRLYQASTSELFGKVEEIPQTETTRFHPRSPYGVAKLYAYWIAINYREAYNIHISNGILFNHCSPRRGGTFASQKIVQYCKKLKKFLKDGYLYMPDSPLRMGNLDSKRDFGWAPEYVESMWLMLQQEKPGDYVIATNETYSIREFCTETFKQIGIDIVWKGEKLNEKGIDKKTGTILVEIDKKQIRPSEVDLLLGNPEKAKRILGWTPKIKFKEIIKRMLE